MIKNKILHVLCLVPVICCQAKVITVDNDGPASFSSIQSAINSADHGDIIIVQPGLYDEDINFLGKNIVLTSTNPHNQHVIKQTIIGRNHPNEARVTFRGTEGPNCTLTGFNINGSIVGYDPSVDPMGLNRARSTISYCLLQGNSGKCGTVIYMCDGTISNCVVVDNINQGPLPCITPAIDECHGLIKNCTIVNNYSNGVGVRWDGGETTIENCIIYGNKDDYQIFVPPGATVSILYSDIQGGLSGIFGVGTVNWGPGNIDTDPCFVREGYWNFNEPRIFFEGDYHLLADSPCIDAGDPNYVAEPNETDIDGQPRVINGRVDIGADEYLPPLEARLLIRPRTINRKSNPKNIMAWLSLPAGVTRDDIDPDVPLTLYPGDIEASRQFIFENNRYDNPGAFILAFFKKSDLMNAVPDNGQVQLEAVGQLNTGRYFFGQRTIRIINPPHHHPNPNYKKDAPTKARSPFD